MIIVLFCPEKNNPPPKVDTMAKFALLTLPAVVCIALTIGFQGYGAEALPPARPAIPAPEVVREKINGINEQMARLEKEKHALEHLTEWHERARERLRQADDELARKEQEELPTSKAALEKVTARKDYLAKQRRLNAELLAIQAAADLEKAEELKRQTEELSQEWELVQQPRLEAAASLEEMAKSMADKATPGQAEILAKFKALAEESAAGRVREFELVKARQRRQEAMEALKREFRAARP